MVELFLENNMKPPKKKNVLKSMVILRIKVSLVWCDGLQEELVQNPGLNPGLNLGLIDDHIQLVKQLFVDINKKL